MKSLLPENLEKLCRERGWPLSRLAREANVPKATLHSWTTGTTPNIDQVRAVAHTLSVSVHQLIWGTPDPHADENYKEVLKEMFSGDVRVTIHRIGEPKGV